MTDDTPTLREMFEFFHERHEQSKEEFEGDVPNQGISAIIKVAQGFDDIRMKTRIFEADESVDTEGIEDEMATDLEEQAIDMLGALALLAAEHGLDIGERFETMRDRTRAIESAESMEELQEALAESGLELETGVEAGDNVDMDEYDGESDRGFM